MITIAIKDKSRMYNVGALTGDSWNSARSVFLGRVGNETEEKMYLATFSNITMLSNPSMTWAASSTAIVHVRQWVDISVEIVGRRNA